MKPRFSKDFRFLSILFLAVLVMGPRCPAQTPATLNVQLYTGLSITGAVGTVYSVEYVSDLAQTNNASAWRCLEYLHLIRFPNGPGLAGSLPLTISWRLWSASLNWGQRRCSRWSLPGRR